MDGHGVEPSVGSLRRWLRIFGLATILSIGGCFGLIHFGPHADDVVLPDYRARAAIRAVLPGWTWVLFGCLAAWLIEMGARWCLTVRRQSTAEEQPESDP